MKRIIVTLLLFIVTLGVTLGLVVPLPSYARGPRVHVRVHAGYRGWWVPWAVGGAVVAPYYWYRPYYGPYYPPPPAVVQEQPPTYVEPEEQEPYYWYYCQNPQGYYPYVQSCQGGWMKVVPNPNPPNPGANPAPGPGSSPGEGTAK